jgi:hypothetical protein
MMKRGLTPHEARALGECACGKHFYSWAYQGWYELETKALVEQPRECMRGRGPEAVNDDA